MRLCRWSFRFSLPRAPVQKFGNGNVTAVDGNKLTIRFDKAGEKRVVDSFVERV